MGSEFSETRRIYNGVPQGSILSPLLFSCLLADLPSFNGVHKLLYADDLSLFSVDKSVDTAIAKIQTALNKFSQWLSRWGLVVNPTKSKAMFFTRKKITRLPDLFLNNVKIPLVTKHKFLGLYLDGPRLLWDKHITFLKDTCFSKLRIMKSLAGSDWGCDRKTLLIFYSSYIRSRLAYGIEVYSSASKSLMSTLEVVQNHALRIVTGLGRSTPIINLQLETGIKSLDTFFMTRNLIFLKKVQGLFFNHRTFQLIASMDAFKLTWDTFPHKAPFLVRARNISWSVGIEFGKFKFLENTFVVPPWINLRDRIRMDIKDLSSINKVCIFNALRNEEYAEYLSFYTDGSKSEQGVGSAVFIGDIGIALSWRIHQRHSVIASELYAILRALKWILENMNDCKCVIFTDSRSALALITNHVVTSYAFLITSIHYLILDLDIKGIEICLQWIPSHCGIIGNEVVDVLAKSAVQYEEITPLEFEVKEEITYVKNYMSNWWTNRASMEAVNCNFGRLIENIRSWKWVSTGCRKADVILARLRSGHVRLNQFLHKIGSMDTPFCVHCPGVFETVSHFIMDCPYYSNYRADLRKGIRNCNIADFNLKLLLTGGGFKPNLRIKVMRLTYCYVEKTKRFEN